MRSEEDQRFAVASESAAERDIGRVGFPQPARVEMGLHAMFTFVGAGELGLLLAPSRSDVPVSSDHRE